MANYRSKLLYDVIKLKMACYEYEEDKEPKLKEVAEKNKVKLNKAKLFDDQVNLEEFSIGDLDLSAEILNKYGYVNQENFFSKEESRVVYRRYIKELIKELTPREKFLVNMKYLVSNPWSLKKIGDFHKVSRERARQIELSAFRKMRSRKDIKEKVVPELKIGERHGQVLFSRDMGKH
jgi:DNA-directed RNA polymerase sigma subunit (sigma70/sigma32)